MAAEPPVVRMDGRREADELASLVTELAQVGEKGTKPAHLSARTRLPRRRVAILLSKYPDYFVKVGGDEQVFALNRFGSLGGSSAKILEHIELAQRAIGKLAYGMLAFGIALMVFASLIWGAAYLWLDAWADWWSVSLSLGIAGGALSVTSAASIAYRSMRGPDKPRPVSSHGRRALPAND
jgi:hypothetical protein